MMIIILNSRSFCNLVQMTEKRNKSIHFSNSFSVSLSQCVATEPSAELVAKYTEMKQTFLARVNNFHQTVVGLLQPALASPEMQQAQAYFNPENRRRLNAAIGFLE